MVFKIDAANTETTGSRDWRRCAFNESGLVGLVFFGWKVFGFQISQADKKIVHVLVGGFGACWRKVEGMVGLFVNFQITAPAVLFHFGLELMCRCHRDILVEIAD